MRRLFQFLLVLGVLYAASEQFNLLGRVGGSHDPQAQAIGGAYQQHASNVQVSGQGEAIRVLADDNNGSRHQRFILRLPTGQTLLVAHNIDLASRIGALREGDRVEFNGEYEWNSQGGVVHWTHHDPQGLHEAGWLKHNGTTYQ